ncbi:Endonuclease/exonuclease/phosphatase [Thamnocephalis sphaerospora]|uniref:Endonuclease/exonuclease/phosphatase n=1 Tax=Thamnocephalis sphaerospora TaxID=78915 RepID=A0A4P9XVS5_9FUNG|nr:Endonuclease/exonuclease/phosphatase [Thamnocephalis sphaerospora]|eukprot:RKP10385.1 Endonuclease/exonuclease/phosphatase [Thamnocephalis sphaerospora]
MTKETTATRLGKRASEGNPAPPAKRRPAGRTCGNQVQPAAGAPTQTTMPSTYAYTPQPEGTLKIVSWNICSMNASVKKGMEAYVCAEQPDIICLQETKLQKAPASLAAAGLGMLDYPYTYYACSTVQKGYSGTAVFSRVKPLAATYGLTDTAEAGCTEGRTITLEFDTYFLVACYVPNAGNKLVRLSRRQQWDREMRAYLRRLEQRKPVVWCGDLNVSHAEIDLARPDSNHRTAGFTDEEREGFSDILGANDAGEATMIDTWRHLHPDERRYSYFSFRFGCRPKYLGWRLDYFVVSASLLPRVLASEIRDEVYGASDHVPIMLLLDSKDWNLSVAKTARATPKP